MCAEKSAGARGLFKKGRGGRPNVFVQEEEKWSGRDGVFSPAAALCQTSSPPQKKQKKNKTRALSLYPRSEKEAGLVNKHCASGCEQKQSPKQFLSSCGQSHNHAVGRPETPQPSLFGLIFLCSLEDETSRAELSYGLSATLSCKG